MTADADIDRFRRNLQDELDGAALYAALAAAESDPVRKDVFVQLSQAESSHARLWKDKLAAAGVSEGRYSMSFRTRLLAKLAQRWGPRFVLPSVAAAEFADQDKYANQADAASLSAEEKGHAAVIRAAADHPGASTNRSIGADIGRAEPWHRGASGNDLRAAVLGANDGLVSNLCLVMGIAGTGTGGKAILLTGLAGLVAGACSMALGEWLSVTNARELATTQIDREREEIEQTPEAEQKELALIFQAKGLDKAEAQRVAAELMRDKTAALDTLVREELGIDPAELGGNAWSAAGTSFLLFALGAIVPVVPFLFASGALALVLSIVLGALAMAGIGVATSLFNGRSAVFSATRQVLIGCAAAAVTYGAGVLMNVSIS